MKRARADYKTLALEAIESRHLEAYERDIFDFEKWIAAAESPIEYLFGAYLYAAEVYGHRFVARPRGEDIWSSRDRFAAHYEKTGHILIEVHPQAQISDYRVDFLILAGPDQNKGVVGIVIECDGHDYHERTKEQAQRDKSRDRGLQALGYRVLRFTGSEIYNRSFDIIGDVTGIIDELVLGGVLRQAFARERGE